MTVVQQQFFAGAFFAAAALAFLWGAFKSPDQQTAIRQDIVHFVCAFCAGAAGGFFTGAALLNFDAPFSGGGRVAFQGTAGVALFGATLLWARKRGVRGKRGAWISIGTETPFEQIAEQLAIRIDAHVDLSSFSTDERRSIPTRSEQLSATSVDTVKASLNRLLAIMPGDWTRRYEARYNAATKVFAFHRGSNARRR